MKIFIRILLACSLIFCGNALAQTDISGIWQGKLALSADETIAVKFIITKLENGSYEVVLDSPDAEAVNNIPATSVAFADGVLTVEVKRLSGSYSGTLNKDVFTGEWSQPGSTFPLVLSLYKKPSAASLKLLLGEWVGRITPPGGNEISVVFRFEMGKDDMLTGFLDIPDQGAKGIAASEVQFEDNHLRFMIKAIQGQYAGRLSGKKIEGALKQGGQEMTLNMIKGKYEAPPAKKAAERKEIKVSPSILEQYVGVYELRPGFDMAITLEEGQLLSQATGQSKVPIFPETETKFFLKVADAQIEFFKDDKGAVTHLMLHQGTAEIKAPRK